jgi:hypothetical protein
MLYLVAVRSKLTIACSEHGSLVRSTWPAETATVWVEEADGVVVGDERSGEGQEVSTICEEDHHGERVAKQELSDACKDEKHATEPDVDRGCRDRGTTRALPPHYWESVHCFGRR